MRNIDRFAFVIGSALLLAGALEAQPTSHRTFDGYGNRSSLESPFGQSRSYEHNYQGVERGASLQGQTLVRDMVFGTHGKAEEYVYDGLGTSPHRLAEHGYDGLGRPTRWSLQATAQGASPDYLADTFIYDERGFVLGYRRSDRSVGVVPVAFDYTTKGQLEVFHWGAQILSYGYDDNGNLNARSGGLGVNPLANGGQVQFSSGNHRDGWIYDLRGRLIEDDQYRYEYDEMSRLRLVRERDSAIWVAHYLYDASGLRARVLEPDQVTYAYRDAGGEVVAEDVRGRDGLTLRHREHVTLNGQRIHTATHMPDGSVQGQQHFTDRMGNPVFAWDGNKETVHEYSPYGHDLSVGGAKDHDGVYGFTGHEDDGATGLTYMRARYYDADAARFNRPDPARDFDPYLPSTVNLYQYARANPVNLVDPDGQQSKSTTIDLEEYGGKVTVNLGNFYVSISATDEGIKFRAAVKLKASFGAKGSIIQRKSLGEEGGVLFIKAGPAQLGFDTATRKLTVKGTKFLRNVEIGGELILRPGTDLFVSEEQYNRAFRSGLYNIHKGQEHPGGLNECMQGECGDYKRVQAARAEEREKNPGFIRRAWGGLLKLLRGEK